MEKDIAVNDLLEGLGGWGKWQVGTCTVFVSATHLTRKRQKDHQ